MTTKGNPAISVCIANYNGEHLLDACLRSVLSQTNAPPYEIIVHDDASTDQSLTVLETYSGVRVIASGTNAGYCVSNNRMAAVATGQFLLLLNNDATLLPDALSVLFEESSKHVHRAVLGMPQYDARDGALVDRGCWLDCFFSPVRRVDSKSQSPAMVMGACLWTSRQIWHDVGGFPDFFATNAEDVYFCCAARWLGYDIAITPSSGYVHGSGLSLGGGKTDESGRLEFKPRRRYLSERNRIFLMYMFLPPGIREGVLALNFLALTLEALALTLIFRSTKALIEVHFRAVADSWHMRRQARSLRTRLGSLKAIPLLTFFHRFRIVPVKLTLLMQYGLPRFS